MVKLQDSVLKNGGGEAQTRIIGNEQLGLLLSQVQSAMIRSGNELEDLVCAAIPITQLTTLAALNQLSDSELPKIQVVFKPFRPDPDDASKTIQADFLIVDNQKKVFTLVEIKEGYEFDTKKSSAELLNLKRITSWLGQEFPFSANFFICSFNQEDKAKIAAGFKNRFPENQILTGREFCRIIGIDYDTIREQRRADQIENRLYFLRQLLAISDIRSEIIAILNEIQE